MDALPVFACTICVYRDILISSPLWNGPEAAPRWWRVGVFFLWQLMVYRLSMHDLSLGQVDLAPGRETRLAGMKEGVGSREQIGLFGLRSGLVVVYQLLSKYFPKSNTFNLPTLTFRIYILNPRAQLSYFCTDSLPYSPALVWLVTHAWDTHYVNRGPLHCHSNVRKIPPFWVTGGREIKYIYKIRNYSHKIAKRMLHM